MGEIRNAKQRILQKHWMEVFV